MKFRLVKPMLRYRGCIRIIHWGKVVVDPQDALSGISREANGAPPGGSMQGRNRTLVTQQISEVSDDPLQALTIQSKAVR